jgi:hypothetical protein
MRKACAPAGDNYRLMMMMMMKGLSKLFGIGVGVVPKL